MSYDLGLLTSLWLIPLIGIVIVLLIPDRNALAIRWAALGCTIVTFIVSLVALWRPEPLPGHPGVRYFTRITRIYTGKRPPPFYN